MLIRYRIGLSSSMVFMFVTGLCFASLRINSPLTGNIMLLTALAVICSAVLMAVACPGPRRMTWIGCAVFGWSCFVLGFWPVSNDGLGPPRITAFLEEMILYVNPELDFEIKKASSNVDLAQNGYSELGWNPRRFHRYRQSSLSVLTLCFAGLGYLLGSSQAARDHRRVGVERETDQSVSSGS